MQLFLFYLYFWVSYVDVYAGIYGKKQKGDVRKKISISLINLLPSKNRTIIHTMYTCMITVRVYSHG